MITIRLPSQRPALFSRSREWSAIARLAWAGGVLLSVAAHAQAPVPGMHANAMPLKGAPTATAVFAGGCFWCIEADFEKMAGVLEVESGYTAGKTNNPTYEDVSAGHTGHTEAVRVIYDPTKVSYPQLVAYFWRHIDPTVKDRQFCDVGSQYRSGIYVSTPEQEAVAREVMAEMAASGVYSRPIVTEVLPVDNYWPAEAYHQDFFERNPHQGYCMAVAAPKVAKFRKTFARLQK